jgi:hypothetical protein
MNLLRETSSLEQLLKAKIEVEFGDFALIEDDGPKLELVVSLSNVDMAASLQLIRQPSDMEEVRAERQERKYQPDPVVTWFAEWGHKLKIYGYWKSRPDPVELRALLNTLRTKT